MSILTKGISAIAARSAGKTAGTAAKAAQALKGPAGADLVATKVDVKRGGRLFKATRYKKADAAGGPAPKSFKQNAIEVIKGGVALKVAKKSAGLTIGAIAAGNEMARRRKDPKAPAPFPEAVTKWDNVRSSAAGAGIALAVAGVTGDILHRIPAQTLSKVPGIGKPLAVLAKVSTHKATHRMMVGGAGLSILNFDAAGRNVARKYDEGKLHQGATGFLGGLKEHAFVLHSGLPKAVTARETIPGTTVRNPFHHVTGYEPAAAHGKTKKPGH